MSVRLWFSKVIQDERRRLRTEEYLVVLGEDSVSSHCKEIQPIHGIEINPGILSEGMTQPKPLCYLML